MASVAFVCDGVLGVFRKTARYDHQMRPRGVCWGVGVGQSDRLERSGLRRGTDQGNDSGAIASAVRRSFAQTTL